MAQRTKNSTHAAKKPPRLNHRGSRGETWLLVQTDDGVIVEHHREAGEITPIQIADFLATGKKGPAEKELLRLIGSLVDQSAAGSATT
jgi:hypothetical protein